MVMPAAALTVAVNELAVRFSGIFRGAERRVPLGQLDGPIATATYWRLARGLHRAGILENSETANEQSASRSSTKVACSARRNLLRRSPPAVLGSIRRTR